MKLGTKVAIGLLLGWGILITLLATAKLLDPDNPPQEREEAKVALVMFGLAPASLGGWIWYGARRQAQQQQTQQLQSRFFTLLQNNNGHITALQLAMVTGLDGNLVKAYLDEQAKAFDAIYDVTADGTVVYYFELAKRQGGLE
ncbi:hypothetical protein HJG54_24500 [Leptolyngbya sp. NK1-12]|uniref:Uncharacterized protein n=1 Tax=Leptolyngbya sp. NK1-12 TaxID=2547451 RepID=A0AA96WJ84_9CYAN|nr:hypothetical protein [Leptolyngbya sp. NK1-12]WNZ25685.1 hypothetical protein HJG54_24500 [Leptolyngbya sp. NK1-12]